MSDDPQSVRRLSRNNRGNRVTAAIGAASSTGRSSLPCSTSGPSAANFRTAVGDLPPLPLHEHRAVDGSRHSAATSEVRSDPDDTPHPGARPRTEHPLVAAPDVDEDGRHSRIDESRTQRLVVDRQGLAVRQDDDESARRERIEVRSSADVSERIERRCATRPAVRRRALDPDRAIDDSDERVVAERRKQMRAARDR